MIEKRTSEEVAELEDFFFCIFFRLSFFWFEKTVEHKKIYKTHSGEKNNKILGGGFTYFHPYLGKWLVINDPIWLIFFKWVEITN